jgi:putative copper resistance protein D
MSATSVLQVGSTVLLNASFVTIVGTLTARLWLRSSAGPEHHARIIDALHRTELAATGLGVFAACLALWAASAVMMGGQLAEAAAMLWTMAIQTAYGQAGLVGIAILIAVGALNVFSPKSAGADAAMVVFLLGFAASRASVSHAGESGTFSLNFGVEWVHLLLIALWLGGVGVAGWIVLPMAHPNRTEQLEIGRYLTLLSHAATVALLGIFATGLYNAWQRVGTLQNVLGNLYGTALLVKVGFIAVAVALGGYNKLFGFPAVTRSAHASPHVIAILRFESLLLLGALAAAAVLTSNQPPMAV